MIKKNPKVDIKLKYRKVFEISLIVSLLFVIFAFQTFPQIEHNKTRKNEPSELIVIEDAVRTKLNIPKPPPPPPKPPIPIEAPADEDLPDVPFFDNDLNIDANWDKPKLKDEKIKTENFIFIAVSEEMPEPIGGIAAIQKRIVYPEIARKAGIQGKVFLKVFVDETGTVKKVEIIQGIGAGCDEAAIAAVMKTKFKPGKQRGKPVKVQVSIPISFKLN